MLNLYRGREKYIVYYRSKGKEDVIMDGKVIKIIGVAASVIGAAATLASNWASEKQTDGKIAEKVAEALAKASEKES